MAVSHKIEEVLVALRRVIRATDLHSRRLVKIANVTGPQLLLLQTLANNGDITISELARDMSLSQATVTTILDRLERRELVSRVRSETDRRKVYPRLTEHGRDRKSTRLNSRHVATSDAAFCSQKICRAVLT